MDLDHKIVFVLTVDTRGQVVVTPIAGAGRYCAVVSGSALITMVAVMVEPPIPMNEPEIGAANSKSKPAAAARWAFDTAKPLEGSYPRLPALGQYRLGAGRQWPDQKGTGDSEDRRGEGGVRGGESYGCDS